MAKNVGVNVQGGEVTKQAVDALADGIAAIFTAAHQNHMDQQTVVEALLLMRQLGTVEGMTISHCNVNQGPPAKPFITGQGWKTS